MRKNTCVLFHSDADGLYSASAYYIGQGKPEIDGYRSIDYGIDHSSLKDQYENFWIFDYAENIGGEKTTLWVDHHLRRDRTNTAELEIIEEAPSCVRLLARKGMIEMPEEDIKCIDIVDSGNFVWSKSFTKEDLLFPEPKNKLSKFLIFNQLLRKNRKHGLAERLFDKENLSVDTLLYCIQKDSDAVKYDEYMTNKQHLFDKLYTHNRYINFFDEIPVLFTREFTKEDWRGYDMNMVGYVGQQSPFIILVFDMEDRINVQVLRNVFFDGPRKRSVFEILKDTIEGDPRGHENILNFTYKNQKEAITKLDTIISKLSAEL
jgi:hypothetical protein